MYFSPILYLFMYSIELVISLHFLLLPYINTISSEDVVIVVFNTVPYALSYFKQYGYQVAQAFILLIKLAIRSIIEMSGIMIIVHTFGIILSVVYIFI